MDGPGQIIDIEKNIDKDERMLPVHFMAEGKKCYDWIREDLESDQKKGTKKDKTKKDTNISKQEISEYQPDEVISKTRSCSIDSYVYKSSHLTTSNDDKGKTQLILKAAEKGDIEELTQLLGASPLLINSVDSDGYTALHRAAYSGHLLVCDMLLQRGSNVNARTDDLWQPIHCAVRWNFVEVCELLLEKNADVNSQTKGLQTPLHFAACSEDNLALLELLLTRPNVNAELTNAMGDTARDIAVRSGPYASIFDMVGENMLV